MEISNLHFRKRSDAIMAEKVLLILVDGMRPDSIPLCGDPGFEAYFKSGT